jgi:hypothetical protein
MEKRKRFRPEQIFAVGEASAMAEELVSEAYRISPGQWLKNRYDVKTLVELSQNEILDGPFAQIIRYRAQKGETLLGSSSYDFYKICLQDHAILAALGLRKELQLFPLALYILCHELIHIVRFSRFLQAFEDTQAGRMAEENRVHAKAMEILSPLRIPGIETLLCFCRNWKAPVDTPDSVEVLRVCEPPEKRKGGETAKSGKINS